jgi:ubiquinone/menaquinone biosynthesis C-methylase UbiE
MPSPANPYPMPKDPQEGRRLNFQHRILRDGLGANYLAPLDRDRPPHTILDVATGTFIWARELAREYRQARVDAFDLDVEMLAQIVGRLKKGMPPNVRLRWKPTDALRTWPYRTGEFDLVHGRYLAPFVRVDVWPHIASEMMRVTRPGGWAESVEGPMVNCAATSYVEVMKALRAMTRIRLGHGDMTALLAGWLREFGAVDVLQHHFLLGTGTTAHLRDDLIENTVLVLEGVRWRLLQSGTITQTRLDTCMRFLREEMQEAGAELPLVVTDAQKGLAP